MSLASGVMSITWLKTDFTTFKVNVYFSIIFCETVSVTLCQQQQHLFLAKDEKIYQSDGRGFPSVFLFSVLADSSHGFSEFMLLF